MPRTECDWTDVEGTAEELAGNHRRFDSFAWHAEPDDGENWAVIYTHHRDSGILDQSNANAIENALSPFEEDAVSESHSHWAVGHVDGYALRVYRGSEITKAFRTYCEHMAALADYPVLDEEDYSRREYESALESIEQEGGRMVKDDAGDWASRVYSLLSDNEADWPHELENRDDQGAYPSRESIRAALFELDLLDAVYTVRIGDFVQLETTSKNRAFREARNLAYHAAMGIALLAEGEVTVNQDDETLETETWKE
jgi:hypothetical protein